MNMLDAFNIRNHLHSFEQNATLLNHFPNISTHPETVALLSQSVKNNSLQIY